MSFDKEKQAIYKTRANDSDLSYNFCIKTSVFQVIMKGLAPQDLYENKVSLVLAILDKIILKIPELCSHKLTVLRAVDK